MTVTPAGSSLVVDTGWLFRKAGITAPTAEQTQVAVDAILDAQSDVIAYLGRPITPTTYVEPHRYAYYDGWILEAAPDEPLIGIVSAVPELDATGAVTDYFTVTYTAGIDARTDPALEPIRRYVRVHALNSPDFTRMWKTATSAQGEIRSVSAEGQSVTFARANLGAGDTTPKPGSGEPGSLPTLGSLDRWRVAGRRAYQAPTRALSPWDTWDGGDRPWP